VTPYTSVVRGIPAEEFCAAIEDARLSAEAAHGTVVRWCFDIPGEAGIPAADLTLDVALRLQPAGLVSFGLGGPEAGVPKSWFTPHFAVARAAGLHSVPHAGESGGPDSVVDALDLLGAERIGHGIAAGRNPAVLERLVDEGVALEVCPTSNVCTRSVPSLAEHPLRALVDAGVTVTVNSDDPTMFSTTLTREYLVAAELLDLDLSGVADLARAAARVSFAPGDVRRALLAEIDAYVGAAGA